MQYVRITGVRFSSMMLVLFFLVNISGMLNMLGVGESIVPALHQGVGFIFSILFSLHLVATFKGRMVDNRKDKYFDSTTYHILHRQEQHMKRQ